jgi:hypothetical protein
LLRALETIAAQMLRLDQREHDLVSFDAGNFKACAPRSCAWPAETAAEKVRQSGVPYSFPPMNSRERRMLHMACRSLQGVETASSGEGPDRFLVSIPRARPTCRWPPQSSREVSAAVESLKPRIGEVCQHRSRSFKRSRILHFSGRFPVPQYRTMRPKSLPFSASNHWLRGRLPARRKSAWC